MRFVDYLPLRPMGRWVVRAACRGQGPSAFFVGRGESIRGAVGVCLGCEVKRDCLVYALNEGQTHGVWGGLSERERARLRRLLLGRDADEG